MHKVCIKVIGEVKGMKVTLIFLGSFDGMPDTVFITYK